MADVEAIKRQAEKDIETIKSKARDAVTKLKNDVELAQKEAQKYKSELLGTKEELEQVRSKAEENERRISELSEAVRSQEGKIADERDVASLKTDLARAHEELDRLRQEQQNTNSNGHQEADNLRELLKKTEEKLNQLKEAAKTHVTKLQQELVSKDKERAEAIAHAQQLESELVAARAAVPQQNVAEDLAGRFEAAEGNLQKATQLLEESEREKNAAREQAAKLEADLKKFREAAKHQVEKLLKELDKKKEIEEAIRKQADEEQKKVAETYEAQIKTLKEAAAAAQIAAGTSAAAPKSVASPAAPSDALLRMNKENKELQMKLEAASKTLQAERDDFKNQSRAARETIERITKESTTFKRDAESAKEEARLVMKDLEKTKRELKKLQEQRLSQDPTEMQKRKEQEIAVYVDRYNKLETEMRKEQSKVADLTKRIEKYDMEIANLTNSHLDKYNKLDRELLEKRDALAILEEENQQLKMTSGLSDQRYQDLRNKSREQFQALSDQLEQAKRAIEKAREQEEQYRQEISQLRRLSDKAAASMTAVASTPPPSQSPPPQSSSASSASFKMLEEEKAKAESKRREAMDDLGKAKRDYNAAKKEAIQLADAVDKLRSGLNKAALQAGGNLAMAADRCDDALRQCVLQVEAALAAIQARELAKSSAPSQSAGLADDDARMTRHRQSSIDEPGSSSPAQGRKEQEPEERLVNALNDAERRLDDMTASLRLLLPKVKQVATIAVQDKKTTSVLASLCNLSAIMAKLFNRRDDSDGESGYTGIQMQSAQRPSRRGRVLPDAPDNESNFELEGES